MFEYLKLAIKLLHDRSARKRLQGLRPVVICIAQSPTTRDFLLVRSTHSADTWAPAQEGIGKDETVEEAAIRCMQEEFGLSIGSIQYRNSVWIADRRLPERVGERDIDGSMFKMKGKSYYSGHLMVDENAPLNLNPTEVVEADWVAKADLATHLSTLPSDKYVILRKAFKESCSIDIGPPVEK